MRKTGGVALAAACLLSACAQSIEDKPVADDFQQLVREISGAAQPAFTGSTCFSKALDHQDSYRYKAQFTARPDELQKAAIERGWQPYRTRKGENLLVRNHNRQTVIVGFPAGGQAAAVTEWNCTGTEDDPVFRLRLDADPDLQPGQKRALEASYKVVRDAGIAIAPLLDPEHVDPRKVPWPPPIPDDYPRTDLQGCDVDDRGAQGAMWSADSVVSGYITDTTDVRTGEQRVVDALGPRWRIADRKQDGTIVFEQQGGRLTLRIKQGQDHRKRPGLDLEGELGTGCVPPTAG